ncbi:MAG: AAC(3) family N-acetyltransferase [Anaerolineae bacterium]
MDPERGDPNITVTVDDVVCALRSVGVAVGDTVHFHSSLSSMGTVVGGADTIIDGFLRAVGPGGTVAVPTLCQRDHERRFLDWDIDRCPSDVGHITEVFRHHRGAIRSDHATHSVAAIGARADELTRDHVHAQGRPGPWGDAAFAAGSPWDKYYRWDAGILFIGVDFNVNTMMHYIQSLIVERVLDGVPEPTRAGLLYELEGWLKGGPWPHYGDTGLEPARREAGLIRYGRLGCATLRHLRARPMVDHALPLLEADPERWFSRIFCGWYRRVQEAKPR